MQRNCWFGSIDFKHAYYSVSIVKKHRKLLKFRWKDQIYQYTCLAQGISPAPRVFTKLMKPPFVHLHERGHTVLGYIDDSLFLADDATELDKGVTEAVKLFDELGLTINLKKSVL